MPDGVSVRLRQEATVVRLELLRYKCDARAEGTCVHTRSEAQTDNLHATRTPITQARKAVEKLNAKRYGSW